MINCVKFGKGKMATRKSLHVYKQNSNSSHVTCTLLHVVDEQVNKKYSFPSITKGVGIQISE